MKYLFLLLLITGCSSCSNYQINQEVVPQTDTILCGERTCFCTYVWYSGDLIQVWYDPVSTITDSLVIARQKQGERMLNALKKSI